MRLIIPLVYPKAIQSALPVIFGKCTNTRAHPYNLFIAIVELFIPIPFLLSPFLFLFYLRNPVSNIFCTFFLLCHLERHLEGHQRCLCKTEAGNTIQLNYKVLLTQQAILFKK